MQAIADSLGLGEVRAVEPVKHRVSKLVTDRGAFHVKLLRDEGWDWQSSMQAGCVQVEEGARAAGVEMAEPVALLQHIGDQLVTVHQWVDGRSIVEGDDVAVWLGETMARLHTVERPSASPADSLPAAYGIQLAADWETWIADGESAGLHWAPTARRALDVIPAITALVADAMAADRVVGSHRDLHAPNILARVDGGFCLVDFEYAGPEHPWLEAVRAAFEVARLQGAEKVLEPDPVRVRSVIDAYIDAGGVAGAPGPTALAGVFGTTLSRVAWFMWQSLGHRTCTADELAFANDHIVPGLENAVRRWHDRDRLASLVLA